MIKYILSAKHGRKTRNRLGARGAMGSANAFMGSKNAFGVEERFYGVEERFYGVEERFYGVRFIWEHFLAFVPIINDGNIY